MLEALNQSIPSKSLKYDLSLLLTIFCWLPEILGISWLADLLLQFLPLSQHAILLVFFHFFLLNLNPLRLVCAYFPVTEKSQPSLLPLLLCCGLLWVYWQWHCSVYFLHCKANLTGLLREREVCPKPLATFRSMTYNSPSLGHFHTDHFRTLTYTGSLCRVPFMPTLSRGFRGLVEAEDRFAIQNV